MLDVDLHEKLRTIAEAFPSGILALYLYGSRARGSARAGSDVDLAVVEEILRNHLDDLLAFASAIPETLGR